MAAAVCSYAGRYAARFCFQWRGALAGEAVGERNNSMRVSSENRESLYVAIENVAASRANVYRYSQHSHRLARSRKSSVAKERRR